MENQGILHTCKILQILDFLKSAKLQAKIYLNFWQLKPLEKNILEKSLEVHVPFEGNRNYEEFEEKLKNLEGDRFRKK